MKISSALLFCVLALTVRPSLNSADGGTDFGTGLALLDYEAEKEADLILQSEGTVLFWNTR